MTNNTSHATGRIMTKEQIFISELIELMEKHNAAFYVDTSECSYDIPNGLSAALEIDGTDLIINKDDMSIDARDLEKFL